MSAQPVATDPRTARGRLTDYAAGHARVGVEQLAADIRGLLNELGRLQAIEQRADEAKGGNAQLHDDEERGWLKAARFVLDGET